MKHHKIYRSIRAPGKRDGMFYELQGGPQLGESIPVKRLGIAKVVIVRKEVC